MNYGMVRRSLVAAGLALAAGLLVGGCAPQSKPGGKTINFSILSTENSMNQQRLWGPFLDDMSKQTGLTIKPFYASNYSSLVEAMRFNQVQLGWFSNFPGLEAVRRGGGEVFAHSTDPSGVDGYFSIIVAQQGKGMTLERLLKCDRTLNFGLGDVKSTSGTLAPMTYLFTPRHIDPQACFKTVRSANHQANLLSVATGSLDAATNNSTALLFLKREHPELAAKIQVIWTSPRLPEDPIIWRKDLDPSIKEKIRSFFMSYGAAPGAEGERQRKILAALNFGTFKPADNSFLLPVREMEASQQLAAARNDHDAAAEKAAQTSLEQIRREKVAAGLGEDVVPPPASAPAQ